MSTDEKWEDIKGWEDRYQVSTHGRVRSKDIYQIDKLGRPWWKKGTIHGEHKKPNGYIYVNLSRHGRKQRRYVHQLVLETFIGARPSGCEACHSNGVRDDNRLSNLRWDTVSENRLDITRMGRHNQGNKTRCVNGHEFTKENTHFYGPQSRWRRCLACVKDRRKANLRRKKWRGFWYEKLAHARCRCREADK